MEEFKEEKRRYLIYFLYAFAVIVLVWFCISTVITIKVIRKISDDLLSGILSLIGSIIGGALTLVGVWWGFRNERKTKFKQNYYNNVITLSNLDENFKDGKKISKMFIDIDYDTFFEQYSEVFKKSDKEVAATAEKLRTVLTNERVLELNRLINRYELLLIFYKNTEEKAIGWAVDLERLEEFFGVEEQRGAFNALMNIYSTIMDEFIALIERENAFNEEERKKFRL
ncbi:hypothetical protein [Priestia aryabhattai]|uniref:hypothetical protein n=1 Tax=Priestia aryabhattai TaxID=412384 RepID=UPI00238001C5|nr:hypothetical protein [Priestia aryabhattai]WDW10699.1 hypothetical protein PWC21_09085 [Priestia aryabhattai]